MSEKYWQSPPDDDCVDAHAGDALSYWRTRTPLTNFLKTLSKPFDDPRRWREGCWLTADERLMYLKDMETKHLVNTAALLWRKGTLLEFGPAPTDVQLVAKMRSKVEEIMTVLRARRAVE